MRKPEPFFVDGEQIAFLQSNDTARWFVVLEVDDIYALDANQVADFADWLSEAQKFMVWADAVKYLAKNRVHRDYADEDDG